MEKQIKTKRKWKKRHIAAAVILAIAVIAAIVIICLTVPFGHFDLTPQAGTTFSNGIFNYDLPLDETSPWPKFRANTLQNGRTPIPAVADESVEPWETRTEKGIFSSPVVDAEGTVYIGSADHNFYAIDKTGEIKWVIQTGEIIDSSALLDNEGRVIFGSGDAKVYCADRESGEILWTYQAQTAQQVTEEFGVETYNVNWFEGNVGILPNGDLLVPNDNYLIYRLNREDGSVIQRYVANEMIWSLPAVNPETGNMFFGSCYSMFQNLLSYNIETGEKRWATGGLGFTAATPLLTGYNENGGVIMGSYDGQLRCLTQRNGKELWRLGLGDHIYASCGQLSDGTLIQPCADGSVYAIDPANGDILWSFDTLEPIRSSPAIGGDDLIYVGSGEGKLFCINPDGSLRWSYQCILEGRNDLNASPALGFEGIYIAGESGEIFFVPYDYPMRAENAGNPRCHVGETDLPSDGAYLVYTAPLGGLELNPPAEIAGNQVLVFSLVARENSDTLVALIDAKSVAAEVEGSTGWQVQVSADRRFLMLIPGEKWTPNANGEVAVHISGTYHKNPSRIGLKFFGGQKVDGFDQSFTFTLAPQTAGGNPFFVPDGQNTDSTVLEFYRQSVPLPTIMPSFNQIGFDSLHYLGGAAYSVGDTTLFWVVGGKNEGGEISFDADTEVRFPLLLRYEDGLATFYNYDGFKINFVGSWDMPIASYRIAATYDPETQTFGATPSYTVEANCDEIEFYGLGLKLMGISDFATGKMYTSGSVAIRHWGLATPPANAGSGQAGIEGDSVVMRLSDSGLKRGEHVYSLLVADENGMPLPLYYSANTTVEYDETGAVTSVSVKLEKGDSLPARVQVFLMTDTYPALSGMVETGK